MDAGSEVFKEKQEQKNEKVSSLYDKYILYGQLQRANNCVLGLVN